MTIKGLKRLSNSVFFISVIFGGGILAKNLYDRYSLPEDVCPINTNYSWMVAAIVLLVFSIIFTFLIERRIKKIKSNQD